MKIAQSLKDQFNLRVHDECIARIEKTLGFITEEEVWYRPNNQANTIGHLILHLCGNVTQWIGTGVGRAPDVRERDAEFNTTIQHSKLDLISRLHALRPITDKALATVQGDQDLLEARSVQGYDETVLSILVHVTEHFSYHTGQIAIIAKYLKDVDLGFYAGQDLNIKN